MKKLREITLICDKQLSPRAHYSLFRISPFMKGQALTVANTLRRVLLNELGSIHITSIVIRKPINILHEFSPVPGLKESLPEILDNLREIVFRVEPEIVKFDLEDEEDFSNYPVEKSIFSSRHSSFKNFARIHSTGKRLITAADIQLLDSNRTKNLHVVDPRQHIATAFSAHASLDIDLELTHSKQYVSALEQSFPPKKNFKIIIPLNSDFSPVKRTNYFIKENESLTYEILFFEIWTDGSITPSEALGHASIAVKQLFEPFS